MSESRGTQPTQTQSIAVRIEQDMTLGDLGQVFAASGFFQDAQGKAQAIVKIMAGQEFGFPPVISMASVYIVKGRPAMAASMMAALVKRHPKYDYRVVEHTNERCHLIFLQRTQSDDTYEEIGESIFTLEDAKKAGTQNLEKFPRNMLFARAMSNGVRWHCPDVFMGPVYVPEEMGVPVNEIGDPLSMGPTSKPARSDGTAALNAQLDAPVKSQEPQPITPEPETETEAVLDLPGTPPAPTIQPAANDPDEGNSSPEEGPGSTETETARYARVAAEAKNMAKADLIQAIPSLESGLDLSPEVVTRSRLDHLHHVDIGAAHVAEMRQYYIWLATR